jgi:hypothetical protein
MPSTLPRDHWVDVEVTGHLAGTAIDETVRIYARRPEQLLAIPALEAAAWRAARQRLGLHPCNAKRAITFGLRDWSDSVDGTLIEKARTA